MTLSDPDEGETAAHLRRIAALAKVPTDSVALPRHHHVILDQRRFHYVEWGKRGSPAILFLHGGNQSARTWDVVCLALAPEFHCIALDQRGHGLSEWSYEFDYTPEASARDVEHLIAHLAWQRFVLVGMSMGCLNGMSYAASNADRLAGFVAVDAGPYIESVGGAEIIDFVQANRSHATLDDFVAAAVRFNPRRNPEFLRHSLRHTVRQMADGTFAWKADRRQPIKLENVQAWLDRSRTLLPRITCPTLVVRGAESRILSNEGAERFARELPDGRTVVVPDAGHTVQGDNPAGLIAALNAFLATLEI
jgi:pimeloyl-ACP methyl ester carboxylesterase